MGGERQIDEIVKLFESAELRYHNLVSFSESHVDEYADIYFSDYTQDMNDIIKIYRSIIQFTENMLNREPSLLTAGKLQIRAVYRLGVLFTNSGQYENALPELDRVQQLFESELFMNVEELSCEYIDACIKKGKCYVEKRAGKDRIEECYYKAEKVLMEIYSYQELAEGKAKDRAIHCYSRKEEEAFPDADLVFSTCIHLATDLQLAWAICCVDAYDRLCMESDSAKVKNSGSEQGKDTALSELEYHLSLTEKLWQPVCKQTDIQGGVLTMNGLDNNIVYIQFNQQTNREGQELEKEEQKIRDTYLSTRGLYHLKKYQSLENQTTDRSAELVSSLHCFINGFLCNTRNTIAMDNIAFIYLRYGKDARIKADEKWLTDLPQNLRHSLLEDNRQQLLHKFSRGIQKEMIGAVKQIISNLSEYYDRMSYSQTAVESIRQGEMLAEIVLKIQKETDNIKRFHKNPDELSELYGIRERISEIAAEKFKSEAESGRGKDGSRHESFQEIFLAHINAAVSLTFAEIDQLEKELPAVGKSPEECDGRGREDPYELLRNLPAFSGSDEKEITSGMEIALGRIYPMIIPFLNKVLEIEPSNMYALNLTVLADPPAAIEKEGAEAEKVKAGILLKPLNEDVFNIYTSLRQSTLKKRFKKLDGIFYGKDPVIEAHIRDIKRSIIVLYNRISKFINSSIIDFNANPTLCAVGHYTKLKNLPKLINQKNAAKLRLTNMSFVNDPSEGKVMIQLLDEGWKELKKTEAISGGIGTEGDVKEKCESVIDRVLTAYHSDSLKRSYVYIACFTACTDSLSMWDRYGDGGKGVCLVVDEREAFDSSQEVDLGYLYTEDDETQLVSMDGKYALHKVIYYPYHKREGEGCSIDVKATESTDKESELLESTIQFSLDAFKVIDSYLKDFQSVYLKKEQCSKSVEEAGEDNRIRKWENFENEVANIIMLILDQARYLVKNAYYRDEEEYRLIKYSSDPKCDKSGEGIPTVYIDMKRIMKYKEICLGPKVKDAVAIGAYILNKKQKSADGSVTGETIVRRSQIPYQ